MDDGQTTDTCRHISTLTQNLCFVRLIDVHVLVRGLAYISSSTMSTSVVLRR